MTTKPLVIDRQPLMKRLIFPVMSVFICWGASTLIYNLTWRFLDASLHRPLAVVCALLMGVTIVLGALLIYLVAFLRGAGLGERVIGCFITPAAWILKELFIISRIYSAGETFYYLFNPLFLGVLSLTVIEMGISEIVGRLVIRRRNEILYKPVLSIAPIMTILLGIIAVYVFNIWGDRVGFWYLHQEFYQYLFSS